LEGEENILSYNFSEAIYSLSSFNMVINKKATFISGLFILLSTISYSVLAVIVRKIQN